MHYGHARISSRIFRDSGTSSITICILCTLVSDLHNARDKCSARPNANNNRLPWSSRLDATETSIILFHSEYLCRSRYAGGFMLCSLQIRNGDRIARYILLKRRSGVYDKYPTDKLWACNGNIAGYRINLMRELIACFKSPLSASFSRPRRSTVIIMDLEYNHSRRTVHNKCYTVVIYIAKTSI